MKKILTIILIMTLILIAFTGCKDKNDDKDLATVYENEIEENKIKQKEAAEEATKNDKERIDELVEQGGIEISDGLEVIEENPEDIAPIDEQGNPVVVETRDTSNMILTEQNTEQNEEIEPVTEEVVEQIRENTPNATEEAKKEPVTEPDYSDYSESNQEWLNSFTVDAGGGYNIFGTPLVLVDMLNGKDKDHIKIYGDGMVGIENYDHQLTDEEILEVVKFIVENDTEYKESDYLMTEYGGLTDEEMELYVKNKEILATDPFNTILLKQYLENFKRHGNYNRIISDIKVWLLDGGDEVLNREPGTGFGME